MLISRTEISHASSQTNLLYQTSTPLTVSLILGKHDAGLLMRQPILPPIHNEHQPGTDTSHRKWEISDVTMHSVGVH
jgi:hypothetical protein